MSTLGSTVSIGQLIPLFFMRAADDVVAQLERDDLFVSEYVLDDNDRAVSLLVGILVKFFLLAGFAENLKLPFGCQTAYCN